MSARELLDEALETARLHDSVTGETVIAALRAAGCALVPVEPTTMMLGKGAAQAIRVLQSRGVPFDTKDIGSIWSAMISASKEQP